MASVGAVETAPPSPQGDGGAVSTAPTELTYQAFSSRALMV